MAALLGMFRYHSRSPLPYQHHAAKISAVVAPFDILEWSEPATPALCASREARKDNLRAYKVPGVREAIEIARSQDAKAGRKDRQVPGRLLDPLAPYAAWLLCGCYAVGWNNVCLNKMLISLVQLGGVEPPTS